ncbi:MAG: protein-disulfide reductase DsbD [Thiothrix sp.]|nr:protein-disulfide reductase DsbD [Thiothrix sp.]
MPPLQAAKDFPIGNIDLKGLDAGGSVLEEPLPPEEAFVFGGLAWNGRELKTSWDVKPEHYLYQDKFRFEVLNPTGFELGQPQLPKGKEKEDEFFGTIHANYGFVDAVVPLKRTGSNETLGVKLTWQGCSEALGICYPPEEKYFQATNLPVGNIKGTVLLEETEGEALTRQLAMLAPATDGATPVATGAAVPAAAVTPPGLPLSEQDRIAAILAGGNIPLTLLAFLGFGLLLSFTPCVFPMIPILSGIIAGQKQLDTRQAFLLSLVYVLAMALTYTVVGVLAGLFGANLQAAFQNPWVLSAFALVFVLLALSMFGFYELQMPSALQSRLNELSNRQAGGTLAGVAIMGVLSALIVGPCVAAPLAGALIYIANTGDAVLGGMALFALSMGMGVPLLVIGTSAGKLLPRAGQWMEAVKVVFGVMLLGVAIYMLERILPESVVMLLWAALLVISAVYMGVFSPLPEGRGWAKLWKGVGILMLVYGVTLVVGAAGGGRDVLQPLKGVFASSGAGGSGEAEPVFRRVVGMAGLEQALAENRGRTVMLDFYADWCVSCKEMEKYTFPDPAVRRALEGVVLLQVDVTGNTGDDKALMKRFGLFGPPAMLFFDSKGQEQQPLRLVGFLPADQFAAHVNRAVSLP